MTPGLSTPFLTRLILDVAQPLPSSSTQPNSGIRRNILSITKVLCKVLADTLQGQINDAYNEHTVPDPPKPEIHEPPTSEMTIATQPIPQVGTGYLRYSAPALDLHSPIFTSKGSYADRHSLHTTPYIPSQPRTCTPSQSISHARDNRATAPVNCLPFGQEHAAVLWMSGFRRSLPPPAAQPQHTLHLCC